MRLRALRFAPALLALVVTRAPALGQEVHPDTLARAAGRSVEALVAEIPGTPVTLAEVEATARERSLELAAARTRREAAEAGLQVERGLFDPAVVLGWSAARDQDRLRSAGYVAGLRQTLPWGTELDATLRGSRDSLVAGGLAPYAADAALSVTQPLLEGLGTADAGVRRARALRQAAVAELARTTEVVLADVEVAYWTLAEAEATEAVLRRSVEIAEALLFRNQALAARQLVPEVDVVTARGAAAFRRAALVGAEQARRDAAERLVYLAWGADAPSRAAQALPIKTVDAGDRVAVPSSALDPEAVRRALAARQDVAAVRAELQAAEESRRATRRGVLPSLDLVGTLGSTASGVGYGGAFRSLGDQSAWSVGLSFSQPLFNRRDRGLNLGAELESSLRQTELTIAENTVRLDVSIAQRALRAGQLRLDAATEAASLAGVQLEAERRRLDLGLGDSFRLLQTEEQAVQSELQAVRARYDLARAITRFRIAVGGG